MPAFERALEIGVTTLELDVGVAADGVVVISHDPYLNPAMHPLKKMKRSEFPKDLKLQAGEQMVAKGVNNMNVVLRIEKISGDDVDVRLVHPLAEKDIKYAVEVVQVTDPRPPPMPAAALDLEPVEDEK